MDENQLSEAIQEAIMVWADQYSGEMLAKLGGEGVRAMALRTELAARIMMFLKTAKNSN